MGQNSFGAEGRLAVGGRDYTIHRLSALPANHDIEHLPFSLKVLLENLLRNEDGVNVTAGDIESLAELRDDRARREGDRLLAGSDLAAGPHRRARRSSTSPRCVTPSQRSAARPTR